jgi:hypothetical protein
VYRIAWSLIFIVVTSCKSQGDVCCDCVLANDCWDHETCPEDPSASCRWVLADGSLPDYVDGDEDQVCFAFRECYAQRCETECDGLLD